MKTGLLWADSTGKPLEERIAKAVDYYARKYGARPTVCFVATDDFAAVNMPGVRVAADARILNNHFWLGMDKE